MATNRLDLQTALDKGRALLAAHPEFRTDAAIWMGVHDALFHLTDKLTSAAKRELTRSLPDGGYLDYADYFIGLCGFDAVPVPDLFADGPPYALAAAIDWTLTP